MFARWEKRLLWGLALLLSVLLVFYALPRQKLLAARFREADRVILTNRIDRISATFVGDDVEKVIKSLKASKRVPPWHRVESTGGYRFEFFRGSKRVGSVEASFGLAEPHTWTPLPVSMDCSIACEANAFRPRRIDINSAGGNLPTRQPRMSAALWSRFDRCCAQPFSIGAATRLPYSVQLPS